MNELYRQSMDAAVDRLYAEQDDVTGVVLACAKKTFFAGGNLKGMLTATADDAEADLRDGRGLKASLRKLETTPARSSPPSTAPHSAAASRSPSPSTTASRWTTAR